MREQRLCISAPEHEIEAWLTIDLDRPDVYPADYFAAVTAVRAAAAKAGDWQPLVGIENWPQVLDDYARKWTAWEQDAKQPQTANGRR